MKNEFVFRFSYLTFENEKRKTNSFFVRKYENEKGKHGIYTDLDAGRNNKQVTALIEATSVAAAPVPVA